MVKYLLLLIIINLGLSATLVGTVKDSDSAEKLMGASIYLKEKPEIGAFSDIEGNYILFDIPNGSYTIVITYIGYEEIEKKIIINQD